VLSRHPYRALGAVLAVMAVSLFVSSMIGQFNDGPWGGLPAWLGALTWFASLGAGLVLLLLAAYLVASSLRTRRAVR
jgi:hypothetical protein